MAKSSREVVVFHYKNGMEPSKIQKLTGIPRSTVYECIRRYKELGTTEDRTRSGRPSLFESKNLRNQVYKLFWRNPQRSCRKLSKSLGINRETLRKYLKKKLRLKAYKKQKTQMITQINMAKRVQKARKLLKHFNKKTLQNVLFSDEKLFTVSEVYNTQNIRIWGKNVASFQPNQRFIRKVQKPASIMVWGGICATGKTKLHFVDPKAKINAEYYQNHILKEVVLPWSQKHFKDQHWTFQQDSAPAHKAKDTIQFCKNNFPDIITPEEWPASSPDLNPLDYSIWSVLEAKVCATPHRSISSLKLALVKAWNEIPNNQLRKVVQNFPKRLRKVIASNGDVFEK